MYPANHSAAKSTNSNPDDDFFLPKVKLLESPRGGNITLRKARGRGGREVVPDSEEDRGLQPNSQPNEIIIIFSSDEEQEEDEVEAVLRVKAPSTASPSGWPSGEESEEFDEAFVKHCTKTPRHGQRSLAARRIVQSSDSEDSEPVSQIKRGKKLPIENYPAEEVIELTSSSEDEAQQHHHSRDPTRTGHESSAQLNLPPYLVREDGGAILILDEPKSARRPLRVPVTKPSQQLQDTSASEQADSPPPTTTAKEHTLREPTSARLLTRGASRSQNIPREPNKRVSKKALKEAEQARREGYAQDLFMVLNSSVFKNGLPQETQLKWNNRLLSTAGRAKYRRSRDGTESAEIELATKILDCDERIRNTLSHEMCHLATWVIDKKLDENHGKLFKYWASKVTRKQPDIEITTRHNYEISYPYKWQCQKCQKIYGRYSKSIRPDECVCGSCREGRLQPLFTVRSKTQTPKISQQAAKKSQDSPRSFPQLTGTSTGPAEAEDVIYLSDVDADVEALTSTMDQVHLI